MELNVNKGESILAELILVFANVLQIRYNSFLIESEQRVRNKLRRIFKKKIFRWNSYLEFF